VGAQKIPTLPPSDVAFVVYSATATPSCLTRLTRSNFARLHRDRARGRVASVNLAGAPSDTEGRVRVTVDMADGHYDGNARPCPQGFSRRACFRLPGIGEATRGRPSELWGSGRVLRPQRQQRRGLACRSHPRCHLLDHVGSTACLEIAKTCQLTRPRVLQRPSGTRESSVPSVMQRVVSRRCMDCPLRL